MLKNGENVTLIPVDPRAWWTIEGIVIEDDGADVRISYAFKGRARQAVVPWAQIAKVDVHEVAA
ncbi:hypothetical protein M2317_000057 [Microbacterium sp. ZKA21]|uniref:hypothetical protein n=1 Tax=Microbacterium sp. ZKA21 TaxID=3381694 RepID=UPI003D1BAFC6